MRLFWRTFLLLSALLLSSVLAWFQTFRTLEQEPRALQSAQALASLVNLTRAALVYADSEARIELIKTLIDKENVRIAVRDAHDTYAPFAADTPGHRVAAALIERLGPDTIVARNVNGFDGLWIGFSIAQEDYWLLADRSRLEGVRGQTWLVWLATALGLSVLGAALMTRLINQPLQRLAQAAARVRDGDFAGARLDERLSTREIASVNRAFNRMTRQLAQLDADRRLMLAGISHDLRTPLARLRLEIEMGVADEATRARLASDIADVDRIIGQFLDYARDQAPNIQAVPMLDVVQRATAPYRERPDVVLRMQVPAELHVLADATALQRVLGNLLENAMRYGRSADGRAYIDVHATQQDGWIALELRDHGSGVPTEALPRLCDPFFRAESARSTPGSGLGLAIVRRAMERMGGMCRIRNAAEGGLVVTLCLRRA